MILTDFEVKVLTLLKEKGVMRYGEILKELGISQGGLTKLLNKLVKKGYLIREVDTTKYPPPVYYKLNPEKLDEIRMSIKEYTVPRILDLYQALVLFDPHEAKKIIKKLTRNTIS